MQKVVDFEKIRDFGFPIAIRKKIWIVVGNDLLKFNDIYLVGIFSKILFRR